jgi:sugar lactone lactonase YvrE
MPESVGSRSTVSLWLLATVAVLACQPAGAQAISQLETKNLRLLYLDPATTYLAPYAARTIENSLLGQRAIFSYEPSEEITALLLDFSDYGNAGAYPLPRNTVIVDVAPKSLAFETSEGAERMYSWMNHELVHLMGTEMASSTERRWRRLFGGKVSASAEHPESILYEYLTVPRLASPLWYHEGIAVFAQTWMAGGYGRAQGGYDEMVFRAMVRDDAHFYDPLGLVAEGVKIDFQVGVNAYLYGTRFMSYVAYAHSPEKLVEWVARTDGSRRHYSSQFRQVFGVPLDQAWSEWIEWEHGFQRMNLAAIRQHPVTPHRDLSQRPLGSVSRAFLDERSGSLFAGIRYPGIVAHIGAISMADGSVTRLQDIKGPMLFRVTSLAWDPDARTLYYTTDNTAWRDIVALDVDTGASRMLMEDARIGDLVLNPADRSLWGIRHLNGIATLVRIPHPYTEWRQVHSFPYGVTVYDLDISPDGSLLSASFGEINGDQSLRVMRIDAVLRGDLSPVRSFDFGLAVPESFVFSPDGRYLYGSAYYTGVSNIFRYELDTGEMEAVSNAETGFFRPIPREDGSLVVFHYTGEGFTPALIDPQPLDSLGTITFFGEQVIQRHPSLQNWQVGSPADIPLEEMILSEGHYRPWSTMGLQSIYPVLEGYKSSIGAGLHATISDPIGFNRLGITASLTPNQDSTEMGHVMIRHEYQRVDEMLPGKWTTELNYNKADFYDIFGPTRVSRKGYSGEVTYRRPIIYDEPRLMDLTLRAGYWGNLDELPYAQDIETTFDAFAQASARLDYSFVDRSLGAVDDEQGHKWSAIAGANHAESAATPYAYGRFDYGWALPSGHSSIWLRSAAGFGVGDRDEVFSNFYFGGFGNNYVDHQDVKRYREPFSMPGFEISELNGRTFGRAMLEWNLAPVRFSRVGTPDFYLSWARPALFAAALVTDPDVDSQTWYSAGFQVDFQFTLLSRKEMTFSIGYAAGFSESGHESNEFMASLKIL